VIGTSILALSQLRRQEEGCATSCGSQLCSQLRSQLRILVAWDPQSWARWVEAVSKRNFATKYAFFQVFRDLQNYLSDFLKTLQNFAKNRKILQNFAK
jgi:hypothetical protein